MFFYWPKLLYPEYSLLLFFLFLSVNRLVLWGWGLLADRVYTEYHSLSALHCRPVLLLIIITVTHH